MDALLRKLSPSLADGTTRLYPATVAMFVTSLLGLHLFTLAADAVVARMLAQARADELIPPRDCSKLRTAVRASLTRLTAADQRRLPLYLISIVHSTIVGIVSIDLTRKYGLVPSNPADVAVLEAPLYLAASLPAAGCAPFKSMQLLLAFSLAYFFHDFLNTVRHWRHYKEDVLHHVLGIALVASCMSGVQPARLAHHILITESSTPLLSSMWLMRKFGLDEMFPRVQLVMAVSFTVIFFVTRLVMLPITTGRGLMYLQNALLKPYPVIAPAMVILCLLNLYWFYRVLGMMLKLAHKQPLPAGISGGENAAGAAHDHLHSAGRVASSTTTAMTSTSSLDSGDALSSSTGRLRLPSKLRSRLTRRRTGYRDLIKSWLTQNNNDTSAVEEDNYTGAPHADAADTTSDDGQPDDQEEENAVAEGRGSGSSGVESGESADSGDSTADSTMGPVQSVSLSPSPPNARLQQLARLQQPAPAALAACDPAPLPEAPISAQLKLQERMEAGDIEALCAVTQQRRQGQ